MRHTFQIIEATDPASRDLISLADLKVELGISGTSEDGALETLITRVSRAFAEYCNRDFAMIDVVETFGFDPGELFGRSQPLVLRHYPVAEIASVTINGTAHEDLTLDKGSARLWLNGAAWSGEIEIQYSGGYDLPDDAPSLLQSALIETVRSKRAFASADPTIRSTATGDTSVSYFSEPMGSTSGFPASVISVLDEFRRKTF